ncbi:zinc-binding dehydrogenase [Kutzneria kofuensis]|uniref:NADPH:quinone reductase-like Zn-dependent oxidoreductase n=1 Tax=Kutzneria kofuensis TaxID=103725 RepID=A0A7W9NGU9_9PSEU|nr:zinc-binding dehydrogenase [Kutzneria kofuensis]MBB5892882.1 NADPH:quinone reductase-like Zn-dependent oxidoreductase [Kutzneria kofuensis]
MRALLVDPSAPSGFRFGEVAQPVPAPNQVLVEVKAISVNYGEASGGFVSPEGEVQGWDAAGVVVQAAADGSGPDVGSRVVTYGRDGGWAQLRAVDTTELAVLPDNVDFASAAAIPVAGATALRALRRLGSVVGKRVLITGAAGGVGRFAVQLAARAGAHVIASVSGAARGAGLDKLGAAEVVVGVEGVEGPLHGVLDNAGGPNTATLFGLLAEGGSLQSIGAASGEPTVFPPYSTVGPKRRLEAFMMGVGIGEELAYLVSLLAAGQLDVEIGYRGSWDRADDAIEALLGRKVVGKAVLDVA